MDIQQHEMDDMIHHKSDEKYSIRKVITIHFYNFINYFQQINYL